MSEKELDRNNPISLRIDGESDPEDPPASPQPDPHTAPDGGLVAWLVILGCWCASFCTFGWLNSVGVFQEYYQNDLLREYSASTVSWIPSLELFFMLGMGPIVGTVYDRYGARWLILIGTFLHVFGLMMTSLSTEYYQLLLSQGLCSAIGVSMIFQPSVNCAAGWFNHNRGAAFGVLFTGSSIGGIVLPILVTHLIRTTGFGWAMRTCAFLMLALLIITNLTVRPFTPSQARKITRAEILKPLRESQFVFLTLGMFIFTYGFYVPINYLPVQALAAGMSANLAQYLVPILNAGSLFGRLSAGFLGDRIGRYNIFIIVCYLSALAILALWLPDSSPAALVAFAVLFGFFSGAYVSLLTPLILQVSPMPELGFRTGIILLATAVGGLTTNPINGAIVDSGGGWSGLKIFAGVFTIVGTSFVVLARVQGTGWVLWARY